MDGGNVRMCVCMCLKERETIRRMDCRGIRQRVRGGGGGGRSGDVKIMEQSVRRGGCVCVCVWGGGVEINIKKL